MRNFIVASLMSVLATDASADARYVADASGTAVIAGPGTIYGTVDRLPFGTRVDVRERYEGYALILMRNGIEAWVKDSALTTQLPRKAEPARAAQPKVLDDPYASVVWTQSGALNLRAGPGLSHAILDECQKGDWVEVVALAGDWSKIRTTSGEEGWVANRYLTR